MEEEIKIPIKYFKRLQHISPPGKQFDIALYPSQNGYLQGNKQKILMNIYMDKEPFFTVAGNVNW